MWVLRYTLRDGRQRGYEQQRLTTAAPCTRCECCLELTDINTKEKMK